MRQWYLWSLWRDLPTFAIIVLEKCLELGILWKRSLNTSLSMKGGVCRVYDLVNCGPMNQFAVKNLIVHNCLGKQFGMGAVKLRRKLAIEGGVYLTMNETKELSSNYDLAVAGTTVYKAGLETEWQQRGGWVMNAFGRPMGVPDDMKKDCANRIIQSTGHDILLTLLLYVNRARKAENLQMFPYIADLHDEMIFETAPQHKERAKAVITEAYAKLNAWLQPLIPIQGTAEEGINLAEIKECFDD